MQYTEEHYAQMYNDLPEGLKDLVLSGRLAILVSAIGSRHGLNADQVADLEPAIEDVCLGLITKDELVDNILKNVNVDQRVANRIAAEAELEILRPFESELVIARKQKEDLDAKISGKTGPTVRPNSNTSPTASQPKTFTPNPDEPKDVSGHSEVKKVSDWYSKTENNINQQTGEKIADTKNVSFDWDKDFAKKETVAPQNNPQTSPQVGQTSVQPSLENKLDVLTESINKLISSRFGDADKKEDKVSEQMQELLKRLEKAEKENEENKKLIKNLQVNRPTPPVQSIFGDAVQPSVKSVNERENKIQIDKERKVEIAKEEKDEPLNNKDTKDTSGNIQITSVSKPIPIVSSTVSKDTLDSIVETRTNSTPTIASSISNTQQSTKKVLSLEELVAKSDEKIKEATAPTTQTPKTLVFPGVNDEKKIDIKNISQKDNLKQILLDDLDFLANGGKKEEEMTKTQVENSENKNNGNDISGSTNSTNTSTDTVSDTASDTTTDKQNSSAQTNTAQPDTKNSPTLSQFKDELLPKTKEERMRALQDKIKALNKGVSVGGKTNISASGLDPYKI